MQASKQINHLISKTYIKSPGRHFKSIDTAQYQATMSPKPLVKKDGFDLILLQIEGDLSPTEIKIASILKSVIVMIEQFLKLYIKQEQSNNIYRSYMQQDQKVITEQVFNPDQKITLSNQPNIKYRKRKANKNQVNYSEKINLKNYQSAPKQQSLKKNQKKQKTSSIKIENIEQKKEIKTSIVSQPPKSFQIQHNSLQINNQKNNQIYFQDQSQIASPTIQPSSKIITTPIYHKNFNSIPSTNIKIEPPSFYQPIKVNPMEKIELGPKIQKVQQSSINPVSNPKKYKIRVLNSDYTSMRYECFCSRQYLSYCATYHHLKKDHFDFLKQNRRFSFTNILQTTDPVHGYRIKKIMRQRLKCPKNENKEQIEKLSKHIKQKIKTESPQIQHLIAELKGIEDQRDQQRKLQKAGELVAQYQNMIQSFQQIYNILNIKQITQKLNNGPTVFEENDPNDQDYFPQ